MTNIEKMRFTEEDPKYAKRNIIPLQRIFYKELGSFRFIKKFYHHPSKSIYTNDTKRMENFLWSWMSSKDLCGDFTTFRDELIKTVVDLKTEADKDVKEPCIFCLNQRSD
jgi:hypothetical protein